MAESRPLRSSEVAATYDRGVEAYERIWSPVILPPAQAVVAALGLSPRERVLDLGTGVGALVTSLRAAADGVVVIGIDPSAEMLRVARDRTAVPAIRGDALRLPLRSGSAQAALLAFVLFHLPDPSLALREASRALAPGGRVGTVTWVSENAVPAYEAWDRALSQAGAAPLAARRVDDGLNTEDGIGALFAGAGLSITRTWRVDLERHWDREMYWNLATGSGLNRLRLDQLEPVARGRAIEAARVGLDALPPEAFRWSGQVLCAVGAKSL